MINSSPDQKTPLGGLTASVLEQGMTGKQKEVAPVEEKELTNEEFKAKADKIEAEHLEKLKS